MTRRRPYAFTLVEVLVVLAVLGVLVALLLPAVQRVREAANATQCRSNLRQLGLAIHAFHDVRHYLPPGGIYYSGSALANTFVGSTSYVYDASPDYASGVGVGMVPFLLSFLEQDEIARQYHYDQDWAAPANTAAANFTLKLLQCPSSPFGVKFETYSNHYNSSFGNAPNASSIDYAAIVGLNVYTMSGYTDPYPYNVQSAMVSDFFGGLRQGPKGLKDVTDGTSSTLLVTECSGRNRILGYQGLVIFGTGYDGAWASPGASITPDGTVYNVTVQTPPTGPCTMNCSNRNRIYSFHPNGCNFLFADASVHFLQENIGWVTLGRLITCQSGEVIGSMAY
jgi:prepilin-type N-terminal cleavage/methylation domain-containing protein/prepilin-type processing-associated H-X9-DG protein